MERGAAGQFLGGAQVPLFAVDLAGEHEPAVFRRDVGQPVPLSGQAGLHIVTALTGNFQLFFVMGVVCAVTHDFITGVAVDTGHLLRMVDILGDFQVEPPPGELLG